MRIKGRVTVFRDGSGRPHTVTQLMRARRDMRDDLLDGGLLLLLSGGSGLRLWRSDASEV